MNKHIYRPNPECAIGNLSLLMGTHAMKCLVNNVQPMFHRDVDLYGRSEIISIPNKTDNDVPVDNGVGHVNGFIHMQFPDIGNIMRQIIKPTSKLEELMNKLRREIKDCKVGFHIRRGILAEDSKKFAFHPFASQEAIDAMIEEANRLDVPVYILSDSDSTKEYFKSMVPKAVSLDVEIGFTSDEHSQKKEVENEKLHKKMNSFAEWFLLSEMDTIYMTNGGIDENMDKKAPHGITSTFGYSAALYGGKIPHYVFNDGVIFYPERKDNIDSKRYFWSDPGLVRNNIQK